jgi:hypothetical protein
MRPKIEDLRKKAFLLYEGPDGVERVDKEVKKMGVNEDKLNEYELKIVLNNIIKNVFIDRVGLEQTKELLSQQTLHVPGYHRTVEEKRGNIHIFERIQFMKWFVVFVCLLLILLVIGVVYYITSFNPLEACEKKNDVDVRDPCILGLALNKLNITYCDKLSTQGKIYNCYGVVGMGLRDMRICRSIPGDDLDLMGVHDRCITCVAFYLRNSSMCASFTSPIKQEDCESQLDRGYSLICPVK